MARFGGVVCGVGLVVLLGSTASAQDVGTFRWQLQPFCNIVTLHVTHVGGVYRLEGADDQCGATTVAPVSGSAAINPTGSIALGLTHVTTPGGLPVHVDAIVTLPGASGTWRDSAGHSGSFVLTPGAGIGGSPRPLSGIGATSVNSAEVQLRVGGTCPAGTAMSAINQNGSVSCSAAGAGDITSVGAGTGLTGGGTSGDTSLAVAFAGPGAATTVARSDHTHQKEATTSIAVGNSALQNATVSGLTGVGSAALFSNTTGCCNTGLGSAALASNQVGAENTAVGYLALQLATSSFSTAVGSAAASATTTGSGNTAVGAQALYANTTGSNNVAVGDSALRAIVSGSDDNVALGHHGAFSLTSGHQNVFVGSQSANDLSLGNQNVFLGSFAGSSLTSGSTNILIGWGSGASLTTGSNNIYLGSLNGAAESNTMRLGTNQTNTFMAGVFGATSASGVQVLVNSNGKLGTTTSSRRFKENIVPLPRARTIVQALRPVQFTYKAEYDGGMRQTQYGLIAEEVEEVDPNLVVKVDGQVETVRYQFLPTLLLAEVQRLEQELQELRAELAALKTAR